MNYCQSGHNWDAQQKQADLGQRRRCGKQWLKGRINRPGLLKHLRISQRKAHKVRVGQAKLVLWDDIKDNPPPQLKISPIAAIPHKSKAFRSILDLSFSLRLTNGGILESVNDSTVKMAPRGALDQLGQALSRIIHAFAAADEDAKIFMAKWDIKDGF